MATPRMMISTLALLAAVFVPQVVMADIAASTLNSSLKAASAAESDSEISSSIRALQSKASSLHKEAASATDAYQKAQLEAVAKGLDDIAAKLKAGEHITDYSVSSDEATLERTVSIEFTNKDGDTSTLDVVIPAAKDPYAEDGTDDSAQQAQADPLTQNLQSLGAQPMASGQTNPFGSVMPSLNGLVNNGGSMPMTPLDPSLMNMANGVMQCLPDGTQVASNGTAVYDITAGKVYMPNGQVLEAHSGLGAMMDNPAYVNQVGRGPTPPGVYSLSMRESLFLGKYEAVRLTPAAGTQMYGRDGILAHQPLRVSSGGGSAGCVAFADMASFLAAFKAGQVTQMVVVPSLGATQNCKPPTYNNAAPTGPAPAAPAAPAL